MKRYILILFILSTTCLTVVEAQVIKNYMISPAAGSYSSANLKGVWSLGEIENGNKEFLNYKVSQGFIKSNSRLIVTSLDESLTDKVRVYPNPLAKQLIIERKGTHETVTYKLIDTNGRTILTKKTTTPVEKVVMDVESLETGTYFLQIITSDTNNPGVFKLIKKEER